jgi:hypothetical protein
MGQKKHGDVKLKEKVAIRIGWEKSLNRSLS